MEYVPATGIYLLNVTTLQNKFQIPKQKNYHRNKWSSSISNTAK